jgi:hypothetical protein
MAADLSGKVAIVTGASSGIGLAVARMFVKRGMKVALVARTKSKLEALARELGDANAAAFPLDVTDRAGLLALPGKVVARFGRLDVVVNNAGVNHRGGVRERSARELAEILEANLVAPIVLTRASLEHMKEGAIVNVASLAGKVPVPHEATYSASKAGLRAFSRAMDVENELHHDAVRVHCVNPGPVDTGFFGDDLDAVPDLVFSQPMSSAEDVAAGVLHALDSGEHQVDVPAISGKLATLGYLSPAIFATLRPMFEKRGAKAKKAYLAKKRAG